MTYTNERRGFRTREAAEAFQVLSSIEPAYCSLHPALRGDVFVRDPIHHAGGKVHTWSYRARSKDGQTRTYFGSYVGA